MLALHASDNANRYTFNDFDINVFTNPATGTIDLVYPTPFIESIAQEEEINLQKWDLETLVHAALTRVLFKQQEILGRKQNSHAHTRTEKEKEEANRSWEQLCKHAAYLEDKYDMLKNIERSIPVQSTTSITLPTRNLMYVVQYAARSIKHWDGNQTSIRVSQDDSQELFVHYAFHALLQKYRMHEQQ